MPTRRFLAIAFLTFAFLSACGHSAPQTAIRAMDDSVATPLGANVLRGATVFAKNCAACHGEQGAGGLVGPALVNERKKKDRTAVIFAIEQPDPPMPKLFPGELTPQDVSDLTAYVETL